MSDEITPQATPIATQGEPAWYPPPQDDNAFRSSKPSTLRYIFFGADGLRAGWSLLLFALLVFVLGWAAQHVLVHFLGKPKNPAPGSEVPLKFMLPVEWGNFALLALAAFLVSLIEKRSFARYGIGLLRRDRVLQFVVGCMWGVALLSLLILLLKLSGVLVFTGAMLHGAAMLHWGFLWAIGFLGVGLFEEFTTRGYIQYTLTRGIAGIGRALHLSERTRRIAGFWCAALIMSFIFGFGHKNNSGESPVGLWSAGLIGLVFCFSLWRTGSLWWAIGWHAAWDWAQSFVYGVADSGQMVQHHLEATYPQGGLLLSGGLTGPEGSIYILAIIALTTLVIALTLKPQPGSPASLSRQSQQLDVV